MKVEDAVAKLKAATHDISDEYSTDECLGFLNTAIQQVCYQLIAGRSPQMVKQVTLHNLEYLPADFVRPAGTYPVKITGQLAEFLDESMKELKVRYFATKEPLTELSVDMPFVHEEINDIAVKVATLIALNQNEYDVTQDKAILDELRQVIAAGMAG